MAHRGPDSSGRVVIDLENGFFVHFISFVLHLRGDEIVPQPLEGSNGNVLQWNGEIFGGLKVISSNLFGLLLFLSVLFIHEKWGEGPKFFHHEPPQFY